MRRGARLLLALATVMAIVAGPGVAWASWGAEGGGSAFGTAYAMPAGPTPSTAVTGRNVAVSWSEATFPNTTPVNAYLVRRFDGGGVAQTVGASCAGTVAGSSCTEAAVPPGTWRYTIATKQHGWTGNQGAQSVAVTVAAPSLTLTPPTTAATLPRTFSGSVASFITGETITFRLDDATSGTVLTGAVTTSPIPFSGTSAISVTIPVLTSAGSHTVYAVGSMGTQASASFTVSAHDVTAPTVHAATIAKSAGGVDGFVRQSGQYYVYANVSDQGSPASGVSTVRANTSTVTTGATNLTMTAGSYTVNGASYNYRSAVQTANAGLSAGAKAFTITATDASANAVTQGGFSVTVDNTAPTASDVQTVNDGATVGRAETGDRLVLTFSEPIDPQSVLAGWDGSSTTVTLRLANGGLGSGGDRVQIRNAANSATLPLGTVYLNDTGYTTTTRHFTSSTMVMSGSTITITLGTASGAVGTDTTGTDMDWDPTNTLYDRAGNACSTTTATESGAADPSF